MRIKKLAGVASLLLAHEAVHSRDADGVPIVAIDIAGPEHGFPADDHVAAFQYAHKHFIRATVHAGEAFGPESIYSAVTDLHASRLGHGFHLFPRASDIVTAPRISQLTAHSPFPHPHPSPPPHPSLSSSATAFAMTNGDSAAIANGNANGNTNGNGNDGGNNGRNGGERERFLDGLVKYIGESRVTIEVCLTSNLQTMPGLTSLSDHNFGKMLAADLSVSLSTDNTLVSSTTVSNELSLATQHFDIDADRLRRIVLNGFDAAFFPGSFREKRRYIEAVTRVYDRTTAAAAIAAAKTTVTATAAAAAKAAAIPAASGL